MRIFPASYEAWTDFLLFPFKAYTVVAIFLFLISQSLPRPSRLGGTYAEAYIMMGYLLCFLVLLIAAVAQLLSGSHKKAISSIAFALAALIIFWVCAPLLANA
jgi:hypothetical protein